MTKQQFTIKPFEYTFHNFFETELYKQLRDKLTPPQRVFTWGREDHISDLLKAGIFYETHTLLQFYEDLPKEGMILDIGANIGNHQMMFNQLWPGRSIFGFEGSPLNYNVLHNNTWMHPNILNVCMCLGEERGLSQLIHFQENMGGSGIANVSRKTEGGSHVIPVIVEPLDTFMFEDDITLIKIDVENFELPVIKGAIKLIEKHKPVIWIEDFNYEEDYENSAVKYLMDNLSYKIINQSECNYLLAI